MNEEKPKSFWTSFLGILTGLTALVTALVGLLVAVQQMGLQDGEFPKSEDNRRPPNSQPDRNSESAENFPNQGFRIVEMMLRADPLNYSGPCPVAIKFSGRISVAGGGGNVSYKFLRSDGASAPIQTLDFASSSSMNVNTTWRLGGSGQSFSGWQSIKTFDPEERQSNKAAFQIHCE